MGSIERWMSEQMDLETESDHTGSRGGRSFMRLVAPPQSPNSRRAWHKPSFWLMSIESSCSFLFYMYIKRNSLWTLQCIYTYTTNNTELCTRKLPISGLATTNPYLFLFLCLSLFFPLFIRLVKERDNSGLPSLGISILKHRVIELLQYSITLGQLVWTDV